MKINLFKYLITSTFVIIIAYVIFTNNGIRYDFYILLLSFFISTFSLLRMFDKRDPYSLNKIFHAFFLFFMGIAPALQFKYNAVFWGGEKLEITDYYIGNILVINILIIYNVFYIYFYNKNLKIFFYERHITAVRAALHRFKGIVLLVTVSIFSFLIFFYSREFNPILLFIREYNNSSFNQSINLIINIFIRPIPIICLIVYKIYYKRPRLIELNLLIIGLLTNFPIGMARFQAATLYIPLIIFYFPVFRKKMNFSILLIVALLIIFPYLNQFRYLSLSSESNFTLNFDPELFLKADFDSYQNFIQVIKSNTVTYGRQLIGVIFFFIPRSMWPNKPIGSGHQMAQDMNLTFSNISMNFFAEGYLNFGYIGILLFIILLAYFNSSLDKIYWNSQQSSFIQIAFPFLVGMEFFLLRGDLMSSFAYTCGILLAILFIFKLSTKQNKLQKSNNFQSN